MYFEAFKLSSKKEVQVPKKCLSREVTRRQVILVPTDTMGDVPSRV